MIDMIQSYVAGILILVGAGFAFVAALGLIRLPDVYSRMHAASKAGTVGSGAMLVAQAWLLHQPAVTSIIVGAKTQEQLQDNLAAADLALEPEELEVLREVSALPPEYPGWMLAWQGRDRAPQ